MSSKVHDLKRHATSLTRLLRGCTVRTRRVIAKRCIFAEVVVSAKAETLLTKQPSVFISPIVHERCVLNNNCHGGYADIASTAYLNTADLFSTICNDKNLPCTILQNVSSNESWNDYMSSYSASSLCNASKHVQGEPTDTFGEYSMDPAT